MATVDVAKYEGLGVFLTHGGGGAAVAMKMACSERLLSGGMEISNVPSKRGTAGRCCCQTIWRRDASQNLEK